MAALEAMRQAMKTVCCVYDSNFQSLHKTHEVQVVEDLVDNAERLLYDPPYNVRHQQNIETSDHDAVHAKIIKAIWEFAENLKTCGGCRPIFRSIV